MKSKVTGMPIINEEFKLLSDLTLEPTGFTNNSNITVTYYDNTEVVEAERRTIVLTGSFKAYFKGKLIDVLVDGWRSPQHPEGSGIYYLYHDGIDFVFSSTPYKFSDLQIAFVQVNGHSVAIRECHGFMDWQTHAEFHYTVGTLLEYGGDLTAGSYTLNSNIATDRRPLVDITGVADEDLRSQLTALTTKSYTQRYLTGSGDRILLTDQTEIIPVNGNIPYWNEFNGTTWQQTPMTNGDYSAMYLVAIPTTADANSQKYRYVWVQPQAVGSLIDAQNHIPANLTIGDSATLLPEYVFIGKLILYVTGNNWEIYSAEKLTGTRFSQVGSPAGNYLSVVATDDSLTGTGTTADPLSVAGGGGAFEVVAEGTIVNPVDEAVFIDNSLLSNGVYKLYINNASLSSSCPIKFKNGSTSYTTGISYYGNGTNNTNTSSYFDIRDIDVTTNGFYVNEIDIHIKTNSFMMMRNIMSIDPTAAGTTPFLSVMLNTVTAHSVDIAFDATRTGSFDYKLVRMI